LLPQAHRLPSGFMAKLASYAEIVELALSALPSARTESTGCTTATAMTSASAIAEAAAVAALRVLLIPFATMLIIYHLNS